MGDTEKRAGDAVGGSHVGNADKVTWYTSAKIYKAMKFKLMQRGDFRHSPQMRI